MAGQQDGPPKPADPTRVQALRETVELTAELVQALATQARRAQRQCSELDPPGAVDRDRVSSLLERLGRRAESLGEDIAPVRAALTQGATTSEPQARPDEDGPEAEPAPDADSRESDRLSDPARMLATEMVTQGRSRAEVEAYLVETFGLDNATEIVDDVWSRTGGA